MRFRASDLPTLHSQLDYLNTVLAIAKNRGAGTNNSVRAKMIYYASEPDLTGMGTKLDDFIDGVEQEIAMLLD